MTAITQKLFVGRTRHLAIRAARAIGLDTQEWMIAGLGFNPAGFRFEKVIILPIVDAIPLSQAAHDQRNQWLRNLFVHMAPGHEDQLFILD